MFFHHFFCSFSDANIVLSGDVNESLIRGFRQGHDVTPLIKLNRIDMLSKKLIKLLQGDKTWTRPDIMIDGR